MTRLPSSCSFVVIVVLVVLAGSASAGESPCDGCSYSVSPLTSSSKTPKVAAAAEAKAKTSTPTKPSSATPNTPPSKPKSILRGNTGGSKRVPTGRQVVPAQWRGLVKLCPLRHRIPVYLRRRRLTVFPAKLIRTMDMQNRTGQVVVVHTKTGRIASVGSLEDVRPWLVAAKGDCVTDRSLINKVVYPGFIDTHAHPLIGGLALYLKPLLAFQPTPEPDGPDVQGLTTKKECLERLKAYEAKMQKAKSKNFMVSWGYDALAIGSVLTAKELDTVSTTRPIVLWDASEHELMMNTAAANLPDVKKAVAKLAKQNAPTPSHVIGAFASQSVMTFILPKYIGTAMLEGEPFWIFNAMKRILTLTRQNGITAISELMFGSFNVGVEKALFEFFFAQPHTGLRCVMVASAPDLIKQTKGASPENPQPAVDFANKTKYKWRQSRLFNNVLMLRGMKFFSDDSIVSMQMKLPEPSYTDPTRKGAWNTEPAQMIRDMRPWWKAGWQLHTHTNGDTSHAALLDILQKLLEEHPRFDHRFALEHIAYIRDASIRRMAALKAVASVNPWYIYLRANLSTPLLGFDRASRYSRLKSLSDQGIPVGLHTDTPVGPPEPLKEVWIAATRKDRISGKVMGKDERVSVYQALRMVTIDAAYVMGVDDRIGSIEAGKLADFVALDADPMTVPVDDIPKIKIHGTVFNGRFLPTPPKTPGKKLKVPAKLQKLAKHMMSLLKHKVPQLH